jgi:glycerophosphoryl diester phosphodiesterase
VPLGSPDRPFVFAHRGSSIVHPEHTIEAYRLAIEEGADGLECDVRLTRDGHLVCVHDPRLDRTSDGRGRVSVHTLAELDRLDFGSWQPGVLTLHSLLSVAMDAGRPIQLLIETKHPTRYRGAVEAAVVALLRRYGLERPDPDRLVQVTAMSFSPTAIRRFRRAAPALPTVMLIEPPAITSRTGWLPFGCSIAGFDVQLLRTLPWLAERMHQRGNRVFAWTVNEPDDVELVVKLGVEGIISDRPGAVLSQLKDLGVRDSGTL